MRVTGTGVQHPLAFEVENQLGSKPLQTMSVEEIKIWRENKLQLDDPQKNPNKIKYHQFLHNGSYYHGVTITRCSLWVPTAVQISCTVCFYVHLQWVLKRFLLNPNELSVVCVAGPTSSLAWSIVKTLQLRRSCRSMLESASSAMSCLHSFCMRVKGMAISS